MLRRDTPKGDRSELSTLLRRLAGPGGSVRLTLGGEEIARIAGPDEEPGPAERPATPRQPRRGGR